MNNRMKLLRKNAHMTQDELANRLSVTRNHITLLEAGKNNPSDRTIKDYCRVFHVSETWLRTGEGEMEEFAGDNVGTIVADLLEDTDNDVYKLIISFLEVYQGLDEKSRLLLNKMAKDMADKQNK